MDSEKTQVNDRTDLPALLASVTTAIESLTAITRDHAESLRMLAERVTELNARVQVLEHL